MTPGPNTLPRWLAALTAANLAFMAFHAWGKSVEQQVGNGTINWAKGIIRVTGSGAPPNKGSPAQRRLMAERAAQADAYRQLAEVVNGVQVTSATAVKDFVTQSDVIRTRVSALIKGMQLVGKPLLLSDGSAEVILAMPLFGSKSLADALDLGTIVEQQEREPLPGPSAAGRTWLLASRQGTGSWGLEVRDAETAPARITAFPYVLAATPAPANAAHSPVPSPQPPLESATGLIVDAAELGAEPAMGPVLIGGPKRVYPSGALKIDKSLVVARGVVHYVESLAEARQDRQRVGESPLLVKAKAAIGRSHSDILIDDESARLILDANQKYRFLEELKVAIVV